MSSTAENYKWVAASQRWYRRLLILYPREHRMEYGDAMAQLFRDQSRDAWEESCERGLLLLWLRILPDLLKTSFMEHLVNLKGKKFMLNKMLTATRVSGSARVAFLVVFLAVFGLVLSTATIVTFILPEVYASVARIKIDLAPGTPWTSTTNAVNGLYAIRGECMVMDSALVLDKVIEQLQLTEAWSKKFNLDGKWKTPETRFFLKRMLEIRPVRNTSLVSVKVYSDNRFEAAEIANSIVENYRAFRNEGVIIARQGTDAKNMTAMRVSIIEGAEVSARPERPNKPLNISLGAVVGIMMGLVLGTVAAMVVSRMQRGPSQPPPLPT